MAGSSALLASQINGGGCLPPPTPGPKVSLGAIFKDPKEAQSNYEKYNKELDPSLAFQCSTIKSMVRARQISARSPVPVAHPKYCTRRSSAWEPLSIRPISQCPKTRRRWG